MLERLHRAARIVQRRTGAGAAELEEMAAQYPELPPAFLQFFEETTDLQLFFKKGYLRLYSPTGSTIAADLLDASSSSGVIPVGENAAGDEILVLPGRGIYRVSEDAVDDLEDLDAEELVLVAPDLETLLSDATALSEASGLPIRRSWREIRRSRRLNFRNAYLARVRLREVTVFSIASVVLATLHFGWLGLLLGVLGLIGVHRLASREYGRGGEGPFEVLLAIVWAAVLAILLLAVAVAIFGGLQWLVLER